MILSIVIAAKDAPAHLLQCCLASFARLQRARDIEILIVNSGAFPSGCEAFSPAFCNFRLLDMEARGVYAAFNRGIEEAQGQYILFFGVDDIALPGMDLIITQLDENRVEYDLFAAAAYMQGYGISAPAKVRGAILFRNWCQQSLFYNRRYLRNKPFDISYRIQADHKANIEMLADQTLVIGRSNELVSYFATGGVSQVSYDVAFRRDLPKIAGENFGMAYKIAVLLKQRLANLIKGRPEARQETVAHRSLPK